MKKTKGLFKDSVTAKYKLISIIVVFAIFLIAILGFALKSRPGEFFSSSASALTKVDNINELSVVVFPYNSIATKTDEEGKILYHTRYEGSITVGFNFDEIKFTKSDEEKIISVKLPDIRILSTSLHEDKLEYIFIENKSETENIFKESYQLCMEDFETKTSELFNDKNSWIFQLAEGNAINYTKAFFKSFETAGYSIEITKEEAK